MRIGKFLIANLLIILFLGVSVNSFGQGCMDGGGDGVNLKGFIQPQWNYNFNGTDDEGNSLNENHFTFNRARLGVLGSIPYDIEYYFFAEMSSFKTPGATPHLLDGFVSYTRYGKWAKISLGQFKTPFSLEQNTSCSGLYTVNRSNVVNQLAGPQRDMGIMVSGGHDSLLLKYNLGIFNGAGINEWDNNTNKEVVGRLVFHPWDFIHVGGSFRMGKMNPTADTSDMNDIFRYGGEILFDWNNIRVQGEYIMGQNKLYSDSRVPIYGGCGGIVGYDVLPEDNYVNSGFLVMASYMTPWNLEPVVKYDSYTYQKVENNSGVSEKVDVWTDQLTFGLNYFINDYSRLQINYVLVTEKTPVDNDMLIVQLQAKF